MKDRFLNYLRVVKNASSHTLRNYGLDIEAFLSFTPTPLEQVEKRHIRAYLAQLNQARMSRRTVLRRLSSLRTFFKYLVREKILQQSPLEEIEGPKLEKTIPAPLAYEQVVHLFSQPDTAGYLGFRDRCILELFYSSGLRISELVGLNRSDFDAAQKSLRVRGKGKKSASSPLPKTRRRGSPTIYLILNAPLMARCTKPKQILKRFFSTAGESASLSAPSIERSNIISCSRAWPQR